MIAIGNRGPGFRLETRRVAAVADGAGSLAHRRTGRARLVLALVGSFAVVALALVPSIVAMRRADAANELAASVDKSVREAHRLIGTLDSRIEQMEEHIEALRRIEPDAIYRENVGNVVALQSLTGGYKNTGVRIAFDGRTCALFVGSDGSRGGQIVEWREANRIESEESADVRKFSKLDEQLKGFSGCAIALNGTGGINLNSGLRSPPAAGSEVYVMYYRLDLASNERAGTGSLMQPRVLRGVVSRVVVDNERERSKFWLAVSHGGVEGGRVGVATLDSSLSGALVLDSKGRFAGMITVMRLGSQRVAGSKDHAETVFVEFEAIVAGAIERSLRDVYPK
ncbi:MAG: hypothetical protein KDC95_19195 [Planctomycetes bacterium]|nr:hypothetical protein [Planctomycetota bacterium]